MPTKIEDESVFVNTKTTLGDDGASGRLHHKATTLNSSQPQEQSHLSIIDIRRHAIESNLSNDINALLHPEKGPKKLPTMLLYDERGLQIFEEITYLDEYYLTNAEIDVLTNFAAEIAQNIQSDSMVIELGSGNLRKVSILLKALDAAGKSIDYYALDLSQTELERTLASVPHFENVVCHGLLGTYDDGLEWIRHGSHASRPKCILSLGSSIGNFHRHEAAEFLKGWADQLRPSDSMVIGLDACDDPAKVYHAYNDREGVTHRFILNGLTNANHILGKEEFNVDEWRVIGEYIYDEFGGRHQAFYCPKKDVRVLDVTIREAERIQVEQSLKYSENESQQLWEAAGLKQTKKWTASHDQYSVHMLTKRDPPFALQAHKYAATTVPSIQDWRGLWATWDTVTRGMIPNQELLSKPIKLRNACIFYIGHIPTFLDIQLNKSTGAPLCEPSHYPRIFERGVDPDVDNPEQCHAHSEIPDEYPPLGEILRYQQQVRKKVEELYSSGEATSSRKTGRGLWIGFEHEAMHLETLLYMLLQSDKKMPPPRTVTPDFESDAKVAEENSVPNEWFEIPQQTIPVGLDDPEDNSGPDVPFGWDNEKPLRRVHVAKFKAQARAITNEEYGAYLDANKLTQLPASWVQVKNASTSGHSEAPDEDVRHSPVEHVGGISEHVNGNGAITPSSSYIDDKFIRTVYGLIPLRYALHWPVFASYNELAGYATWAGGRIPTADEVRSIYVHADHLRKEKAERQLGKTVPAVNASLVNNGVEETPPTSPCADGNSSSEELYADLEGANVGFKHWHPVAVTDRGNELAGQAELGGVWEWTSSVLEKHDGFEPMPLYLGYTADFFDTKHNIVLGGSWATHPRIAGRKTFVNWYQRNYPYAWVGARLVRDN